MWFHTQISRVRSLVLYIYNDTTIKICWNCDSKKSDLLILTHEKKKRDRN